MVTEPPTVLPVSVALTSTSIWHHRALVTATSSIVHHNTIGTDLSRIAGEGHLSRSPAISTGPYCAELVTAQNFFAIGLIEFIPWLPCHCPVLIFPASSSEVLEGSYQLPFSGIAPMASQSIWNDDASLHDQWFRTQVRWSRNWAVSTAGPTRPIKKFPQASRNESLMLRRSKERVEGKGYPADLLDGSR